MGAACVRRLAAEGVRCAIGYVSNDEAARRTAAAAAQLGPEPVLVRGDVATDAVAMVEAADRALDGIASVVTTVYPHVIGRALRVTREEYQRAFDVQYWGTLDAVRAAAPSLESSGGAVVAITSIATWRYARYYGALGPAKAAQESLIRYLAAELGPRGIRANAVQPQLVVDPSPEAEVGREDDIAGFEDMLASAARRTPLRRLASPDEVADVCVALLSSDFRYVTGQVIAVDGGYTLLA